MRSEVTTTIAGCMLVIFLVIMFGVVAGHYDNTPPPKPLPEKISAPD